MSDRTVESITFVTSRAVMRQRDIACLKEAWGEIFPDRKVPACSLAAAGSREAETAGICPGPDGAAVLFLPDLLRDADHPEDGGDLWACCLRAAALLDRITAARPGLVVCVSDFSVYGKVFGSSRMLREEELGYLGHTAGADRYPLALRFLEEHGISLAKETGVPVVIVRCGQDTFDAGKQQDPAGKESWKCLCTALVSGKSGTVYNLPCDTAAGKETGRSPLSPIAVTPDAEKILSLKRSMEVEGRKGTER